MKPIRQAIQIKYLPATSTKGSRYKATCERGSITRGYNSELSDGDQVAVIAMELCKQFDDEDIKKYGTKMGYWANNKTIGCFNGDYYAVFT